MDIESSNPMKQHPYRMNPANNNLSVKKFNICCIETLLKQAKAKGVLLVFLYQNLMGHFVCAQTIVK